MLRGVELPLGLSLLATARASSPGLNTSPVDAGIAVNHSSPFLLIDDCVWASARPSAGDGVCGLHRGSRPGRAADECARNRSGQRACPGPSHGVLNWLSMHMPSVPGLSLLALVLVR